MPVGICVTFPLCTVSMGMLQLFLGHIVADGTMLVILLRGSLSVPGVGLALVLCTADSADMVVLNVIRVCRKIAV